MSLPMYTKNIIMTELTGEIRWNETSSWKPPENSRRMNEKKNRWKSELYDFIAYGKKNKANFLLL